MAERTFRIGKYQQTGYITVENGATAGAIVGKNLYNVDGSLVDLDSKIVRLISDNQAAAQQTAWGLIIGDITQQLDLYAELVNRLATAEAYTDTVMAAHVADADPHPLYALKTVIEPASGLVAALPAAPTFPRRLFVTDSTVTLAAGLGLVVGGGGGNFVPVYWDGAAWRIG